MKECNKDTKQLFSIVNNITNNKKENLISEGKNLDELKRDFSTFCLDKITKNHEKFINIDPYIPDQNQVPKFTSFAPMTNKEVLEMMSAMKDQNKSFELDTVPTALLKKILPRCIDTIMQLVNISFTMREFCCRLLHKNY